MTEQMIKRSCRRFDAAVSAFAVMMLFVMISFETPKSFAASKGASFTVVCKNDDRVFSNMEWKLYRVGKMTDAGYRTAGDFRQYRVDLTSLDASSSRDAVKTLENYAIVDNIAPMAKGKTDSSGTLTFDDLGVAMYMLCGTKTVIGDDIITPSPILFEVTQAQTNKEISAYAKFSYSKKTVERSDHEVKKVWTDDKYFLKDRPASVSVEIFADGKLWKKVTLNEKNKWTYSWSAEKSIVWNVKETVVPEKYTVIYRSNETQFIIENGYNPDIDVLGDSDERTTTKKTTPITTTTTTATASSGSNGSITTSSVSSGSSDSSPTTGITATGDGSEGSATTSAATSDGENMTVTTTAVSGDSSNSESTTSTDSIGGGASDSSSVTTSKIPSDAESTVTGSVDIDSSSGSGTNSKEPNKTTTTVPVKLPQTGQTWWPVPVLAAFGAIFIAVGIGLERGNKKES